MILDQARTATHLAASNFQQLFVEELGWDNPKSKLDENVEIDGNNYTLKPVSEKRGVRIFHCPEVPGRAIRQRIEKEITKLAFEHLIIFTSQDGSQQIWQWVAREKGKAAAFREHVWLTANEPDALIQKLNHIVFSLNEEEALTLSGTTRRLRDAFDREKITKKFYTAFKEQHDQFLGFITGLTSQTDREWYASLMLNRLMFVYFIQKKGFLDNDIHYLRNRLTSVRATIGQDQFHSFYRTFLVTLFHGGLATPKGDRDHETKKLIGAIPYLNGGLFEPHALEIGNSTIQISDEAFENIFVFFDEFDWTLDTRAISRADGKEINPDVLGHIFEKYINQKQMGAYYTKEDVTDYITKNTVIPWLFEHAKAEDKVAFEKGGYVWRLLAENPDDYIYDAMKHGVTYTLPEDISVGVTSTEGRESWNQVAGSKFGLPTEVWREVIARRNRYTDIKSKIQSGDISSINDLITYNLNIRQFARDAIQYAEGPDVVRAFWKGISRVKVLDPACGSGAFLFAALNILYDLYDACLERMEQFVSSAPDQRGGRAQKYSDFRTVLKRVKSHPSRDYFIYKSIIIDNLYGVDIMDEAVEICKLRLFLKLASQIERADQIEPLPDIDFNIRAGNTLIGYSSMDAVEQASSAAGFDFEDRAGQIKAKAEDLDHAFQKFREQQTKLHGVIEANHKIELRSRLSELESILDIYLAKDYGVKVGNDLAVSANFLAWKASHKPFHWLIEFYGIISEGGFDVVIGNPPYVKASKVKKDYTVKGYETERCSDMYAWIMERAAALTSSKGAYGMIVPLSLTFSGSFQPLRDFLLREFSSNWLSSFARIPAALFSAEVRVRNTIHLGLKSGNAGNHTTITHRWFEEARPYLVEKIEYANFDTAIWNGLIPKLSNQDLLRKLEHAKSTIPPLDARVSKNPNANQLNFKKSAYNWVSFGFSPAPAFASDGTELPATESGKTYFDTSDDAKLAHTFLNGKIAFIWWMVVGDDFHVTKGNFEGIPFCTNLNNDDKNALIRISAELHAEMEKNTVFKLNAGKRIGNYNLAKCRKITDKSDIIWARSLGLGTQLNTTNLVYSQIVKTVF